MNPRAAKRLLLLCLPLLLVGASVAAEPIHTIQGEDLPLKGTAPGLGVIYLFFTGPNLPDQGITLEGGTTVLTGNPASFTRVQVNTDGTWAYTWRTGEIGRILSPGTYTLYTAQEPLARPDLDDSVFAVQPVVFGGPGGVSVDTAPAATGTLVVDSSPSISFVRLDDRSAGITPLLVSGIPPGPHTVIVTRPGYREYRAEITITAGEKTEVFAVLQPLATTPGPAGTLPPAGTPAVGAPLPVLVPLGAAALGFLGSRRRS